MLLHILVNVWLIDYSRIMSLPPPPKMKADLHNPFGCIHDAYLLNTCERTNSASNIPQYINMTPVCVQLELSWRHQIGQAIVLLLTKITLSINVFICHVIKPVVNVRMNRLQCHQVAPFDSPKREISWETRSCGSLDTVETDGKSNCSNCFMPAGYKL